MAKLGDYSPWGKIEHIDIVQEGIQFVQTARHGGIKLDRKRNAKIPEIVRRANGWYEEDCEWSIPCLILGFTDDGFDIESARATFKEYYPHEYMVIFNEPVTLEESYKLRQEEARKKHAKDYIAVAAFGASSWEGRVPEGKVVVVAAVGGKREGDTYWLVDKGRYEDKALRCELGYVVNPAVDVKWNRA